MRRQSKISNNQNSLSPEERERERENNLSNTLVKILAETFFLFVFQPRETRNEEEEEERGTEKCENFKDEFTKKERESERSTYVPTAVSHGIKGIN